MQIASCFNPYPRNEPARSPGESTAKGFKQNQLPRLNAPVAYSFIQSARDRGRRGITVAIQRHHDIVHRHAEFFAVALIIRRLA